MSEEKEIKGMEKMFKSMKGVGGVLKSFTSLLDKLGVIEPIMEIFGAFMEILGTAFMPLIEKLSEVLLKALPYVMAFAEGLGKLIDILTTGDFWKKVGSAITDWFKEAWLSVKNWFSTNIIDPIKNFFRNMLNGIVGFINTVIDGINVIIPGKKYDIPKVSVSV